MNPILEQTIYYAMVMIITLFLIGILQRGFFWKFFKVKISFGKNILVKIRAVNRDHYAVGRIEENFLVYKKNKKEKRICIKDKSVFYRSLGTSWVDVDEEKSSLVKSDHSVVDGFDAVKYNNLYKRTLYSPQIADNKDKIIIGCLILIIVLCGALAFFLYKHNYLIEQLMGQVAQINKGIVTATATI